MRADVCCTSHLRVAECLRVSMRVLTSTTTVAINNIDWPRILTERDQEVGRAERR